MAKPKFSLTANPTFKATVAIPVPGDKSADVQFTFKGRTRDELSTFVSGLSDKSNIDVLVDLATGWDLDDTFNREALELLDQNYLGAAAAIIDTYFSEINKARLGN